MATITQPAATRSISVSTGQPIPVVADASTNWWQRANGGAWSQIGTSVSELVWTTPTSVTRRWTFDELQIVADASEPSAGETGGLHLNLCEGPVTVLQATSQMPDPSLADPPLRPFDLEDDDPPLGAPLVMAGANRDGFGTVLQEAVAAPGGPANVASVYGPGLFLDTAGKLGARTNVGQVRGLGVFPHIASYYHSGLYFQHDFGRSRALSLTRVLYVDGDSNVAVVRGDGRRSCYRYDSGGGTYEAAASCQNTLTTSGGTYTETTPSGTEYHYSSGGALEKVVNRYGTPVYYDYDADDRLQKIRGLSGAQGLTPYLSYDGNGQLSRLVLEDLSNASANRTTYFAYSSSDLVRVIGPEGCITYFAYSSGYLQSVTDPENYSWQVGYDGSNRVDRVEDALAATAYFAHDTATPLWTREDRTDDATYLQYNAFGSPEKVFNVDTPADYYTFDGEGNLTAAKNRLGDEWTYEYNSGANRIAVDDPLSARTYYAYDSDDLLRHKVDPLDRTTYLTWDGDRNRTAQKDAEGNTTSFGYQSTGLLHYRKDRRDAFSYFAFDDAANLTAQVDALGNISYFDHNSAGEQTAAVDPLSRCSYYLYDKRGRVVETKNPLGATREYLYDGRCNLVTEVDERHFGTYHTYDGNSNRTLTVDALGSPTYASYDAEERPIGHKNANLHETTYTYDELGRQDKVIDALGFTTYYEYTDAHQVERTVDARGNASYMAYDCVGRQQVQKDAYFAESYYGYDLKGNQIISWAPSKAIGLVWTDSGDDTIKRCTADGTDTVTLVTSANIDIPRAIAVDNRRGYMYWLDSGDDDVKRAKLDGSGVETLVTGLTTPRGIALDVEAEKMYWTDSGSDKIQRADFDGSNEEDLVTTGLDTPQGIAVDPEGGKMYWTDSGNDTIKRADLDGSNVETLISTGLTTPREISVDPIGQKMYWVDSGDDTVKRADLDGSDVETLVDSGLTTPRGISIDVCDRKMYWIDSGNDKIKRAELDGSDIEEVLTSGLSTPEGLALDAPFRVTKFTYDDLDRVTETEDALFETTQTTYDAEGNTLRQIDALGQTTYFTHDLLGRQTHTEDALGNVTYVGYDQAGQVVLQLDQLSNPSYMTYDDAGRQRHAKDAYQNQTYAGYDPAGNAVLQLDKLGYPTYVTYDAVGRRTVTKDAYGVEATTVYDRVGNVERSIDKRQFATYYTYDALERQVHAKDPVHFAETYMGFDEVGNQVLRVDQRGGTAYLTFDRLNRQQTVIDAAQLETYYVYDAVGNRVALHEDRDGSYSVAYLTYDVLNRVTHSSDFRYGPESAEYNAVGNRTLQTDHKGHPAYFGYDVLNRQVTRTNAYGDTDTTVYDERGSVTKRIDGEGRTSYFTFDRLSRQTHQSNSLGETSYFGFNERSERVLTVNPRSYPSYFTYDRLGRLSEQTDTLGGTRYFGHDQGGNQVLQLDELQQPTYHSFDGLGRVTGVKDALMAESYFGYDSASNLVKQIDANSVETTLEYDTANRVTKRFTAGETTIYYDYDAAGNVTSVEDETGTTTNTYTLANQLATKTTEAGLVRYSYNAAGLRDKVYDPSNLYTGYTHDEARRVVLIGTQEPDLTVRSTSLAYDASSKLTRRILPNNRVMSYYTYDDAGRLEQLEQRGTSYSNLVSYFRYARNENGAIESITHEGDEATYYAYDELDRLTAERRKSGATTLYGFTYSYDAASNRETKTDEVADKATYYTHDARNLMTKEYVLQDDASTYFAFDQAQRMEKLCDTSEATYFSYNARSMVTAIDHEAASPDAARTFDYNGLGEAVIVQDNASAVPNYWSYDSSKLLLEKDNSGNTFFRYRHNQHGQAALGSFMELQYKDAAPVYHYPVMDERGSVVKLVDDVEGAVTETHIYDAFGVQLAGSASSLLQRMGFGSSGLIRLNTTREMYFAAGGNLWLPAEGVGVTGLRQVVAPAAAPAPPALVGPPPGPVTFPGMPGPPTHGHMEPLIDPRNPGLDPTSPWHRWWRPDHWDDYRRGVVEAERKRNVEAGRDPISPEIGPHHGHGTGHTTHPATGPSPSRRRYRRPLERQLPHEDEQYGCPSDEELREIATRLKKAIFTRFDSVSGTEKLAKGIWYTVVAVACGECEGVPTLIVARNRRARVESGVDEQISGLLTIRALKVLYPYLRIVRVFGVVPCHAEENVVNFAKLDQCTNVTVSASDPYCPACHSYIYGQGYRATNPPPLQSAATQKRKETMRRNAKEGPLEEWELSNEAIAERERPWCRNPGLWSRRRAGEY